jgi:hypothetical protein
VFSSLLLAVLLSASGSAKEPISLASPGLTHLNLSPETATYYSDHLAQQLALEGMRVITATEISSLIGFERQKQLLGCSDTSSSCIAELANALGVDGLITGSIGKFGQKYQVNVKILAAADGKPLSVHSSRVTGEEALLDELTRAAQKMSKEVYAKLRKQAPPPPPPAAKAETLTPSAAPVASPREVTQVDSTPAPASSGLRRWSWIPMVAGGAAVAGGVVFTLMAGGTYGRLEQAAQGTTPLVGDTALALKQRGQSQQTMSFVFYGIGAAGLLAGGAMYLWGAPASSSVSWQVSPSAEGATVSVGGGFW